MSLSVSLHTSSEILDAIGMELGAPPDFDAITRALVSEHLRAAIYHGSEQSHQTGQSSLLHSGRLMAIQKRNLGALWSSRMGGIDAADVFHSTLDDLAMIGDTVPVGGGYWMPAPTRLVASESSAQWLVFGGAPRDVIGATLETMPRCVGTCRFISESNLKQGGIINDIAQTLDEWLGEPEPLRSWTQRTVASHASHLSTAGELQTEQLEIYAPDIFREKSATGRWMPATNVRQKLSGLRLFRPTSAYSRSYDRPYYLGDFKQSDSAIVLNRSVQIDFETSRRLRFGLDDQLGTHRSAFLTSSESFIELDLQYALPEPEAKILSLGWKKAKLTDSTRNPRTVFPRAALPVVNHVLKRLFINCTTTPWSP